MTQASGATQDVPVRERILAAASRRYYADGIRAASADRLLAEAGVSKVTFYRYFPTKDDLVVAYLQEASAAERARVAAQRAAHPDDPVAVLRWYAGAVGQLACGPGFRGCLFINAAAELPDGNHPGRAVIAEHRAWLQGQAAELLAELQVRDPQAKAAQLMMLRDGAMVAGYLGSTPESVAAGLEAAARAVLAG
ncbi:TetR/AcrR family transcriptional regulator [Spongisporangium articulatum]|uniref:TetR/AcrR family transcriptional regulator n=1 Tax=Spongisporangium articulatum TaxID=3362603 RepID=A0ABW8AIH2_9ACTN